MRNDRHEWEKTARYWTSTGKTIEDAARRADKAMDLDDHVRKAADKRFNEDGSRRPVGAETIAVPTPDYADNLEAAVMLSHPLPEPANDADWCFYVDRLGFSGKWGDPARLWWDRMAVDR